MGSNGYRMTARHYRLRATAAQLVRCFVVRCSAANPTRRTARTRALELAAQLGMSPECVRTRRLGPYCAIAIKIR